ncbi:DUF5995 family protein [Pseudonocardia kunmingensis]|uniref:Uncharacterized protein n=1 Tax=Pseudonocardia kunmingensis TaxID=630975 RepID=A0A543DYJ6_9PSEU|nr:DUF5995 family protein [Pseudonocardia kunmingensis]TQM14401.1 hypothetical protein FB558_1165 [Pseudonocardia kunmingensis]
MIEATGPGVVGTDADNAPRPHPRADGLAEAVVRLQAGADARDRGHGAGPVGQLLTALAGAGDDGPPDAAREFRAALVAELMRRYLRAVRGHARAAAAARVWRVVLDRWEAGADPARTTLAGAHALVGYDLPPAVVSACTVLGRVPGRVERAVVRDVVGLVSGAVGDAAADADLLTRADARDLVLLFARGEHWRRAVQLWAVRGRPSEAEKERAALDASAAPVAEVLLGG